VHKLSRIANAGDLQGDRITAPHGPPLSGEQPLADVIDLDRLRRRDLLGGLIHEYQLAA